MKTIKWYRECGVFDDLQVVPAKEFKDAVRRYGTHEEGCQWQVFPPGDRDCSCGLHAIIGVPDFAVPKKGNV